MSGITWVCVQPDCDGEHHYFVRAPAVVLGEVVAERDG